MRALAVRHDVLAIEVLDPVELGLPSVGLLTLVDPESGKLLEVQTGKKQLREKYEAAASEQRAEIAAALRRAGAAHLQLRTDRDWLVDMVRFVAARRARCLRRSPAVTQYLPLARLAMAADRGRRPCWPSTWCCSCAGGRTRSGSPTWSCSASSPPSARAGAGTWPSPRCCSRWRR